MQSPGVLGIGSDAEKSYTEISINKAGLHVVNWAHIILSGCNLLQALTRDARTATR